MPWLMLAVVVLAGAGSGYWFPSRDAGWEVTGESSGQGRYRRGQPGTGPRLARGATQPTADVRIASVRLLRACRTCGELTVVSRRASPRMRMLSSAM